MKKRRNVWIFLLGLFFCLVVFGLSTTAVIVSREGVDGLFKRKRAAVEQVMPEAVPIVDEVEGRVRERLPAPDPK